VDILQQVITEICTSVSRFAIQLDESTDMTNCAQLPSFARFVRKEGIAEELLNEYMKSAMAMIFFKCYMHFLRNIT